MLMRDCTFESREYQIKRAGNQFNVYNVGVEHEVKMLEEEKKNLVAAVKILQENEFGGDTNSCNDWENVSRNNQHKARPSESSVILVQNNDKEAITTNRFSNLVDKASQDSIQHSLYAKRHEEVCGSRQSQDVNVQHCTTGSQKSQRQTERIQRTNDEGETTKSENERALHLDKTINIDEASQDSTQNSQQDEIIEGSKRVAGSQNNKIKNKNPNSHKEGQHKNAQRSLKPIVIIGDSIIKHINPKKLSRRPVKKFTYPGKTCEEIAECIDNINVNDDPSAVIIHCGTNNLATDQADVCVDKLKNLVGIELK